MKKFINKINEKATAVAIKAQTNLAKIGGALVPFVNNFSKDTQLYRLMSTNPNERL